MNRTHYIQLVLLISASLIYLAGLTYLNQAKTGGPGLIETFYFESSAEEVSAPQISSEAYAESVGLSLTEFRAAYGFIGLSFAILVLIIFMALKDKVKIGHHTVQIPLIAVSVLLLLTFTLQLFRFWF